MAQYSPTLQENACLSDGLHVICPLRFVMTIHIVFKNLARLNCQNQPPVVLVNTIPELNSEGKISSPARRMSFLT